MFVCGERFGNIDQNPFKIPVPFDSQPSLLLEMYSSGMLACPQRPWREGTEGSGPSLSSQHPLPHCPGTRPPPAATSSSEPPSGSSPTVFLPGLRPPLVPTCVPAVLLGRLQQRASTWHVPGLGNGGGLKGREAPGEVWPLRNVEPVTSPGL